MLLTLLRKFPKLKITNIFDPIFSKEDELILQKLFPGSSQDDIVSDFADNKVGQSHYWKAGYSARKILSFMFINNSNKKIDKFLNWLIEFIFNVI